MMKMQSTSSLQIPLGTIALILSGIFFVLYPVIRPFSDESSLQGAAAFASYSWVLAHSLAIAAFILLTLGILGLYILLKETRVERHAMVALVLIWIGVGLTLPYYGAETFGLHTIGQEALRQKSPELLSLANSVRWQEGIVFIGSGLLLLAAGTIVFAVAIWKSGSRPRWSGIPLAIGFALYLPQFGTPQEVRVTHGLLIMIACILIAWSISNRSKVPKLQKSDHTDGS
jgi:hypothetical protein